MVDAATWDGVLVRYGQAMIAAQGMERAMFALLLVRQQADAIAAGEDHTDIDKVVKFVRATPGTLIGELTERGLVEDEGLAHRLREAKKARDLLAHWYLRDHESAARKDEHLRIKMGERLDMCSARFQRVQSELERRVGDVQLTLGLPLVPDPASPFQVDIFDCIASPEDARLLRDLDFLEQSALGQAYDEDAGDFDVPLPHPFDDSSAPWD
jgi:hypothetical protein